MKSAFTASSPGRLDVMGGIADYSGSLVLQMAIKNQTTVTVKLRTDFVCTVTTDLTESIQKTSIDYQSIINVDYTKASQILNQDSNQSWIAYIIGCAYVLEREKGIDFRGADFSIQSDVPLGKGVSSSAALEVATMKALGAAFGVNFSGTELPRLAQQVENRVVGAPCGLMDQLASFFGKPNHLLPITCQPDLLREPIAIPENINFIGIDSGVRHAVAGSSYANVRCAAFMGYSIIAQRLGVTIQELKQARDSGNWSSLPYNGYLCNIPTDEFERSFKLFIPEKISGKDFLTKFQLTTDLVTKVNSEKSYSVLSCTQHPVFENARAFRFLEVIQNTQADKSGNLKKLGELMYQSHHSYTQCGLGSARTDEIVDFAGKYSEAGIYGAKITGGGSGGTVCLLAVGSEGINSAKKIHREMESTAGTALAFFS